MEDFSAWVGRSETAHDVLSQSVVSRLSAVLDHPAPPWGTGVAPPLAHWLCFLPDARQSDLDVDGHPRRGGFLPPVPLPRRMWAGGRLEFLAPLPVGDDLKRRSTIVKVTGKKGTSGELVFVTVRHEVSAAGQPVVVEEQDIVYRDPPPAGGPSPTAAAPPPRERLPADVVRQITATPDLLFRFSALTFNAHRIHYDRDYARGVEGYAGLVVQGPLLATLLMDHLLRVAEGRRVGRFSFRGARPVLDTRPFDLGLAWSEGGGRLWAHDGFGSRNFEAEAMFAEVSA